MRSVRSNFSRWLLASAVLIAGCSSEKPEAKSSGANSKARANAAAAPTAAGSPAPAVRRSDFSTNSALRDPFFPGVKRRVEVAETPQTRGPVDAERHLRQGFQGIFGAGRSRLALINNVMLEPGRTATIPVMSGNQRREITVRVRDVLPTAVILEVQGEGRTITISTANSPAN
jgi:hypothetical protein